jgi:hypothetical protein
MTKTEMANSKDQKAGKEMMLGSYGWNRDEKDSPHPPTFPSNVLSGNTPLNPRLSQMIHVTMASAVMTGTKCDVITSTIRSMGALFV